MKGDGFSWSRRWVPEAYRQQNALKAKRAKEGSLSPDDAQMLVRLEQLTSRYTLTGRRKPQTAKVPERNKR